MSCPHFETLTCKFLKTRSEKKIETGARNVVLWRLQEFTSLWVKRFFYSAKIFFLPRPPSNPTPFCRKRNLFLTVFVMKRHCLQLKRKTNVNETCRFPFDPVCNLYMHRDLEMEKCCLRRVEWIYCYIPASQRVIRQEILYIEEGCRVC